MPGYKLMKLDLNSLAPKYKCVSCELLLRDAMQMSCGHFYCLSCLDTLIAPEAHILTIKCLQDGAVEEVFPDIFMRMEISQLRVRCTFTDQGCTWKGEVKDLEMHSKTCMFLHNRLQTCDYCEKHVKLHLMEVHHKNDCPAYPVICVKCNKGGIPRSKNMSRSQRNKHLQEHAVPHTFLLLKLATNLSRDVESLMCRNPRLLSRNPGFASDYEKTISDILSQVQGVAKGNKELSDKLRDQSQRIAALERGVAAVRVSTETRQSIPDNPANCLDHSNDAFRSVAAMKVSAGTASFAIRDESGGPRLPANKVTRRLTNLENRTADHEVLLVENNRNTDDLRQQINSLGRQLESALETIRRLERKVESHEHVLAIRNVALADLEEFVRHQQVSSYDGALLWKIDDYARRKNDAVSGRQTSFYSPCFYTSRHGYKMCARVYLNGDGMGKGTHISVFFVVMRGHFDALIRWPFRQKVTIMLLDQDNVEHMIDAFRPDPNSSSFQRPQREMNVASGCPLFCSLAELNKHAYVRDDVMFMKIIVDTSDL